MVLVEHDTQASLQTYLASLTPKIYAVHSKSDCTADGHLITNGSRLYIGHASTAERAFTDVRSILFVSFLYIMPQVMIPYM